MNGKLKTGITNTSYGVYGFEGALPKIAEYYDCIDYQGFVNVETDFFNLPFDEFTKELEAQKALIRRSLLSFTAVSGKPTMEILPSWADDGAAY